MRQRRNGCIINISSVAGRISCSPLTPYTSSKWALEALSEGLAGRIADIFEASLQKNPVPPSDVAKKILEVADSGTWQLRHPVGSGADGFLQWRKSFTDEEWATLYSSDDETWYARIERDFGLDTRPDLPKRVAS